MIGIYDGFMDLELELFLLLCLTRFAGLDVLTASGVHVNLLILLQT